MDNIAPSAVRVTTVHNFITKEPAFSGLIGPANTEILRRDNTKLMFPECAVKIAATMMAAGKDPVTAGKVEVLAAAATYFGTGTSAPPATPTPVTATSAVKPVSAKADTAPGETKDLEAAGTGLPILSLLLSARELAKHDTRPGAVERASQLSRCVEAYQKSVNR